ncbi:MAG: 3-deoxy-manno-octulosonate cytidylyltransferase [Verrucomicrobiales bacterium]|nr:3-deoxy-manno-octulosonate cytidylyltransferase [Verrucomicrobiales bacterium]
MPDPNFQNVLGVIPARWASTRFPGKPLELIGGKPLVQHVWDQCARCRNLGKVVVATDDDRIFRAVQDFGGEASMTRDDHPSGTDRMAEVAEKFPDHDVLINIQGDEPLIDPELIDELAGKLLGDPDLPMITAANPMQPDDPAVQDENVVKVTIDRDGHALYFSRSPIPFPRNTAVDELTYYRHKGIYGFRRDFLLEFVSWAPSILEQTEGLEQLRAMENGARIRVILTGDDSTGIDTPEQAAILNEQFKGD